MVGRYPDTKRWRNRTKKNHAYNAKFMKRRRRYFRKLFIAGFIKYEDIPKSYRNFKDHDLIVLSAH